MDPERKHPDLEAIETLHLPTLEFVLRRVQERLESAGSRLVEETTPLSEKAYDLTLSDNERHEAQRKLFDMWGKDEEAAIALGGVMAEIRQITREGN